MTSSVDKADKHVGQADSHIGQTRRAPVGATAQFRARMAILLPPSVQL
jgi:hypothetical protein